MSRTSTLLRALTATVLLSAALTAAAQEVKLFLVDEGASDPSWTHFKARLLDALEKRDQKFVLGVVDGGIRNISDRDGVAEFRKLWEPQSASSPLWTELPKLLFLGGVFVKRERRTYEFCAPYVHYRWPDNSAEGATAAIVSSEALLKANPAANAPTLQTLSYDLVKVLDWEVADEDKDSRQEWVKVQTKAGVGYVPEEQVRSPLEYRACFVKRGAGWRMTGLEVGE